MAALVPPDAQVLAEAAAAAIGADGLMTAWTSATELLSMELVSACRADALSAGWAVARVLGGGPGTSVEAEPVSGHRPGLRHMGSCPE